MTAHILRSLLTVLLMAGSLVIFGKAVSYALDDLHYTAVSTEVSFWGRGEYRPSRETRSLVATQVDQLLIRGPNHPLYLVLAANATAWRGYYNLDGPSANALARRAVKLQESALVARPAYLPGWEALADYAVTAGLDDKQGLAEDRTAQLRGGRN